MNQAMDEETGRPALSWYVETPKAISFQSVQGQNDFAIGDSAVELARMSQVESDSIALIRGIKSDYQDHFFHTLLNRQANVLWNDESGKSALDYAVMLRNTSLCNLLLHGLHSSQTVPMKTLQHAITLSPVNGIDERPSLVSLLLSRYNIDEVNPDGDTFQMLCCRQSLAELVRVTFKFKANPTISNKKGETAFFLSLEKEWFEEISLTCFQRLNDALVSNGSEVDSLNKLLRPKDLKRLHICCKYGLRNGVEDCLQDESIRRQINVKLRTHDDIGSTGLFVAALHGRRDVIQMLLENGAEINVGDSRGASPLHAAIKTGQHDIVNYLLFRGANVNATNINGNAALFFAAYYGQEDIAKALLAYVPSSFFPTLRRVDINAMNRERMSAITVAALNGFPGLVQLLLDKGADLDLTDNSKVTALYAACQKGCIETVRILLNRGADPNRFVDHKNYPIHAAAAGNCTEIVLLLIYHGAAFNVVNTNGANPLILASKNGHCAMIRLLIAHNMNVNATDTNLRSALWWACKNGHEEAVVALLNSQADANQPDNTGVTPIMIAISERHTRICEILHPSAKYTPCACGKEPSVLYSPCNHLGSCYDCFLHSKKTQCPRCGEVFKSAEGVLFKCFV